MKEKVNKKDLLRRIAETTDEETLMQIQELLTYSQEKDFWDELTPEQQQLVDTGIKQSKTGQTQDFYAVLKKLL